MAVAGAQHDLNRPPQSPPLVLGNHTFGSVTEAVCRVAEQRTPLPWFVALLLFALPAAGMLFLLIGYLIWEGIGIWGVNVPVSWGWAIVNFVFWIGIGHAGTLISAILYLFRQQWRTSINRFAEAMTIFAVACAGIFPAIHVGRVWVVYWMFPVPNQMWMWPNFRSPLIWDVFAVSTYATVSFLFWYTGMIPDLATFRDRARNKFRKALLSIASFGWRGANRHWRNYESMYLLLAGLSTPLVLSVHSVVSFDFAVSVLPGWHTTIFPPYFVAGAIFSGFAMVLTLIIPAREWFGLKDFVTPKHLDNMCKIMLATSLMVGYAYFIELFTAWYSGNLYERAIFIKRMAGPYSWAYWTMVTCNVFIPQVLWLRKVRYSALAIFVVSIFINIGMWFERFVIVATSLAQDFLPSSWDYYQPTWVDVLTFVGSFGLFFTLFLLFLRFLPILAISEIKGVMSHHHAHYDHGQGDDTHGAAPAGATE